MEETEDCRTDLMQRMHSSSGTSSSSIPKQQSKRFDLPQLNTSQVRAPLRHFSQSFGTDNKRPGIPPSHPHFPPTSPYSQVFPVSSRSPGQPNSQNPQLHFKGNASAPSHSRSLSQPAFFSLDSLPPLSPSPYRDSSSTSLSDPISADISMEDRDGSHSVGCISSHTPPHPSPSTRPSSSRIGESLPPRKAHRRSHSEIPFVFSGGAQASHGIFQQGVQGFLDKSPSAKEESLRLIGADQISPGVNSSLNSKANQYVKRESDWDREESGDRNVEGMGERKSEGEVAEDLFSAYMNLDDVDTLNYSGTMEKQCIENHEDLDSGASGTKANCLKEDGIDSSDNEAESSANETINSAQQLNPSYSSEKKEGNKQNAGSETNLSSGSSRHSRSISMDSFMGKMHFSEEFPKLPPSPGNRGHQHSHSNSMDGSSMISLDFGNGEFSGTELKKIMANEKLAEIALTDPKRAKRILANRQSAARSKERKMRYISELEHKVQTLQTEATTLSAQLTLLQRDSAGLTNQNNELKFRLQAMEQQAQLRDALNEALTEEVQRLKLATAQITEAAQSSNNGLNQQLPMNHAQMFQLQQQQPSHHQLSVYQLQQQQHQHQQQHNSVAPSKREPSQ